jgi:hypothetical protein
MTATVGIVIVMTTVQWWFNRTGFEIFCMRSQPLPLCSLLPTPMFQDQKIVHLPGVKITRMSIKTPRKASSQGPFQSPF